MNGLMLHCGAHMVERDKIYEVETPQPTRTHFPIPHTLLLEEVERNLGQNGFEIAEQAHALTQHGQRYFGMIEVRKTVPCLDTPDVKPDYALVIGLRNAHDMSWSAALAMGSRVFVCDNLAFSGEVLVGRRHTAYITRDLPRLVPRAFAALGHERVCQEKRIDAYKEFAITDKDASDMIIRSVVDEKVFPAKIIPKVVEEWRRPKHEEFGPRTVWSLSNAFTEAAKPDPDAKRTASPALLMRRTMGLYGFFDKAIGLSLPTREEILSNGMEDVVTRNDAFSRN